MRLALLAFLIVALSPLQAKAAYRDKTVPMQTVSGFDLGRYLVGL